MEKPGARLVVAASCFAAGAFLVLALVWFWPDLLQLLRREEAPPPPSVGVEEKLELIRQFDEAPYGEVREPTAEDKTNTIRQFEVPPSSSARSEPRKTEASQEDKLKVLNMF